MSKMIGRVIRKIVRQANSSRWNGLINKYVRHRCEDAYSEVHTAYGFKMLVNPRLYSDSRIYFYGNYDPEMSAFIASHMRTGMVGMDVGACHGYFSLLMAKSVGPHGHVYSFEPFPQNYTRVRDHIEMNKLTNVDVFPRALSDTEGRAVFMPPSDEASVFKSVEHRRATRNNPGTGYLAKRAGEGAIEVVCVTLDKFVENNRVQRIDLLKVDVEGGELAFLRGARCLRVFKPILLMEFSYTACERSGYSPEELYVRLEELSYQINWYRSGLLQPFYRQDLRVLREHGDVVNVYAFVQRQ